jgi:hypothetical protein|tara:strand:- start:216 stop:668 length:453 start_codon:yes stop_codon:yes gene_type:complete
MEFVQKNKKRKIEVYKGDGFYLKKFFKRNEQWLETHVENLQNAYPNYLLDYGAESDHVWTKVKQLPGKEAWQFEQTEEFIKKIVEFCKANYKKTYPYAHTDWGLSNILIDGDNIYLCDWDGVAIYPKQWTMQTMYATLVKDMGIRVKKYF